MTFACMILAATLAVQADKPFVSQAGTFKVAMPSAPKEQNLKVPTEIGEIEVHLFVADMGSVAYFTSYNDYPASIRNAPPDNVLEGCVNGSITQVKGTLLNKKDIKLGAIPGKEIEYTMPLPGNKVGMGRSRIFLDKTRLYQVLIVGEKDKVMSKSGDDFLKSFDVTKQISP